MEAETPASPGSGKGCDRRLPSPLLWLSLQVLHQKGRGWELTSLTSSKGHGSCREWLLSLPHLRQLQEEKLVIAASLWGPGITQCHLRVPSLSTDSGHLRGSMLMSFFCHLISSQ